MSEQEHAGQTRETEARRGKPPCKRSCREVALTLPVRENWRGCSRRWGACLNSNPSGAGGPCGPRTRRPGSSLYVRRLSGEEACGRPRTCLLQGGCLSVCASARGAAGVPAPSKPGWCLEQRARWTEPCSSHASTFVNGMRKLAVRLRICREGPDLEQDRIKHPAVSRFGNHLFLAFGPHVPAGLGWGILGRRPSQELAARVSGEICASAGWARGRGSRDFPDAEPRFLPAVI